MGQGRCLHIGRGRLGLHGFLTLILGSWHLSPYLPCFLDQRIYMHPCCLVLFRTIHIIPVCENWIQYGLETSDIISKYLI